MTPPLPPLWVWALALAVPLVPIGAGMLMGAMWQCAF